MIDGPVSGAAVFVDLNCNDVGDADEPTGTTDRIFFAIRQNPPQQKDVLPRL